MATKGLPSIPSIPGNISPDLYAVLSAIKTQIDFANNSTSTTNAVDQAQLEAAVANAVSGITKGDTGSPGAPGSNGANGKSYVLDITGGRTSIIYDAAGSNPLPAMTAFGCQLYEDGVVKTPSSYSWFISDPANSLLSGTGSDPTFTPTVAGTFNQTKGDNAVVLVVSYAGLSIRATEPIAITKVGSQGATGPTGPQGTAGTPGTPGTSSYFHVAYADSADGSVNFNQVSGSYIGTYVDSNPTDSALPSAYQWVLIKGAQGPTGNQGIPGTNGADGTTSYLHIKYSNDGGTTFTASGGETVGDYLGQYVDNTLLDSTNPADYTWALIKGADGSNGKSYLLFITGGKTNAVYDESGENPLPAPTAFSAELYEDGTLVTPDTFAWSVPASNSLLSGSETASTFTPTLASSFDAAKSDNRVLLTVTYNNGASTITAKAVQPIVISKQASAGTVDTTPPAAIDDLFVTGGVLYNFVTWGTIPGNTDHVEVYRASTDDRTSATVVGSSKVKMFLDYIPEGVGTTYYYWIRAISKAGVTGDWNLVSGVVSSAGTSAAPLAIGDSQVGTISANKIIAATLSAFSADLGTVTAGLLTSADNNFKIDLTDKSITIAGPAGLLADDYTLLKNGKVEFWKWTGSAHQQGQSLNTIESGTAANGSTVTLSKWYASIPNIIVTPNDTPVYNATYTAQSQKLQVRAEDVAITGGGSVSFKAVSRLVLSGSNPSTVVNDTYTGSSNTDVTATRTTSANTTRIDCNISFSSKQGTGTILNFNYRKVDARIAYRVAGSGGAFTFTAWTTTNINADFNTYTASLTTGTIANGSYEFYVEFAAANRGGTFTSGAMTPSDYDYLQNDVYLAADSSLFNLNPGYTSGSLTASVSMPGFTPASGYSVYQVNWTVSYGRYLKATGTWGSASARIQSVPNGGVNETAYYPPGQTIGTLNVPAAQTTYTFTEASYSPSKSLFSLTTSGMHSGTSSGGSSGQAQARIFAAGTFARIFTRKPKANSATPENVFTLISYSLTLSTATVIDSSGTLNWVAIG